MKIFLNKNKTLVTVVLIIISASVLLFAYSTGKTGVTRKNGNGCTCHNPTPSPNVVVTIIGPDTLLINQSANYSVTISGGPLVRAGTDIAVSSGTLASLGSDLRLDPSDGELTHTLPKAPSSGKVTFSFLYTAPAVQQTITIYANGNSVNFNGVNDPGDQWNFAPNKNVVIVNATGIKNNFVDFKFALNQNYPNPFNPSTMISYQLAASGNVVLKVYDMLGREVTTLVNEFQTAGLHTAVFNMQQVQSSLQLPSGVYFYKLESGNYVSIKKMVLLK